MPLFPLTKKANSPPSSPATSQVKAHVQRSVNTLQVSRRLQSHTHTHTQGKSLLIILTGLKVLKQVEEQPPTPTKERHSEVSFVLVTRAGITKAKELVTTLSDAAPWGSPGKPCKLRSPEVRGTHTARVGEGSGESSPSQNPGASLSFVNGTGAGSQEVRSQEVRPRAPASLRPLVESGDPLGLG